MTVNYVYLGYGTTDENGECKLDHDANGDSISHSYTGTGAGKIDMVASLDSPSSISDSSLVSETYEVLDCYKYDSGQSDYTNIWYSSGSANLERKGDYSEITEKNVGTNGVLQVSIPPINICVEFDFKLLDGTKNDFFYQFSQSSTYLNGSNFNYNGLNFDTEWHHCKIVIGENTNSNNIHTIYIDNTNGVNRSMDNYTLTNNILFSFWTAGDITTIDFKNWKCYPI